MWVLTGRGGAVDRVMRHWLRSPQLLKLFVGQHIVNGVSVAAGVAAVSAVAIAILGFAGGQLATLGAIGASIADFPAPWRVKARTMLTGFILALVATTGIQLLDWSIAGEIVAIGVISFAAGLVTGFGRWALSLSMQMLVPMVFMLGLPPMDLADAMRAEAVFALGGFGYIGIALALTGLVAVSDRRLMASECFRELAAYLWAIARFSEPETDIAEIYGAGIRQQAALSEQLQAARGLLLTDPLASPERMRLAAMIGVLLDVLDALVAVQSDMPRLRAAPIAQMMLTHMGGLYRAGALDIQHLSLDLLAHKKPAHARRPHARPRCAAARSRSRGGARRDRRSDPRGRRRDRAPSRLCAQPDSPPGKDPARRRGGGSGDRLGGYGRVPNPSHVPSARS